MRKIKFESYKKHVLSIHDSRPLMAFYCKGGVGDCYYFLAFVKPLLDPAYRRIIAADVYVDRGVDKVLLELCQAGYPIDELWIHNREFGARTFPLEFKEWNNRCPPGARLFMEPLNGVGIEELPTSQLEKVVLNYLEPIVRVPPPSGDLPKKYITLQMRSSGKDIGMPEEILTEITHMNVIVMTYPGCSEPRTVKLAEKYGFKLLEIDSAVKSLSVQAGAQFHIGIESCQVVGAVIHGVRVIYFPCKGNFDDYQARLGVEHLCMKISKNIHPKTFLEQMEEFVGKWYVWSLQT